MGLMRNKNLEQEYLNALEDLGLEVDFETKETEMKDKENNKNEQ